MQTYLNKCFYGVESREHVVADLQPRLVAGVQRMILLHDKRHDDRDHVENDDGHDGHLKHDVTAEFEHETLNPETSCRKLLNLLDVDQLFQFAFLKTPSNNS